MIVMALGLMLTIFLARLALSHEIGKAKEKVEFKPHVSLLDPPGRGRYRPGRKRGCGRYCAGGD